MFRATGRGGVLLAGGRRAATLGDWSLIKEGDTSVVSATLTGHNDLILDAAPTCTLVLAIGAGNWRWRGVAVSAEGNHATLTCRGRPEQ